MSDENQLKIVNVVSLQEPSTSDTKIKVPDKPLLKLIEHLMKNNEEKTILTNSQLLDILIKEYGINTLECHMLERDIYISVLKKFLKLWPRWDVLIPDDSARDKKRIYEEYADLKKYLKEMLDLARLPTIDAVEDVKKIQENFKTEGIMEVTCTKKQLNRLFFQKPHPNYQNTIFNVGETVSEDKINLRMFNLNEILNWPNINISVNCNQFEFTHKNCSKFHRKLVNKKLRTYRQPPKMSKDVLYRSKYKITKKLFAFDRQESLNYIDACIKNLQTIQSTHAQDVIQILNLFRMDISLCPNEIDRTVFYKYYLSKDPYVRHYKNPIDAVPTSESDLDKYDLVLEEFITPSVTFDVSRISSTLDIIKQDVMSLISIESTWFRIECTVCDKTFFGLQNLDALSQHFSEEHCNEPNWRCTKCNKSFCAQALAGLVWKHKCD